MLYNRHSSKKWKTSSSFKHNVRLNIVLFNDTVHCLGYSYTNFLLQNTQIQRSMSNIPCVGSGLPCYTCRSVCSSCTLCSCYFSFTAIIALHLRQM